MSINQLTNQSRKKWLSANIGGVDVDGQLTYDTANMAPGDSLVLNASHVAKWIPVSALALGSVYTGRLKTVTLNNATYTYQISSVNPFPAVYTLVDNSKITVNKDGVYSVMCLTFATDTTSTTAIEIAKNGVGIAATRQANSPTAVLGYNKQNCFTYYTLPLLAGDYITIIANSPSGANYTTFVSGSFVVVSQIQ